MGSRQRECRGVMGSRQRECRRADGQQAEGV